LLCSMKVAVVLCTYPMPKEAHSEMVNGTQQPHININSGLHVLEQMERVLECLDLLLTRLPCLGVGLLTLHTHRLQL